MAANGAQASFSEKLEIKRFLSLENAILEIKPFTVITGDMGSGKSLLIKVLEFFETVFTDLFILSYRSFVESLNFDKFYSDMAETFRQRFHLNNTVLFDISYECSFGETILDIRIFRNEASKNICVKSEFLEKELPEWKGYLNGLDRNQLENMDGQMEAKLALYERLSQKFGSYYPISTTFVPATRAALAISKTNSSERSEYYDYYLNKFNNLVNYIKGNQNSKYENEANDILKAEMKINGDIRFISKDDREVEIANASSGQQEIAYILLLLSKLFGFQYRYGEQHYIFMEEPETHLFPLEQKLVLELICKIFNDSYKFEKELPVKFFITTHSPYVLRSINNMLLKGGIIEKFPEQKDFIEQRSKYAPYLDRSNLAAIYIEEAGGIKDILREANGDYQIDPKAISDISKCINDYCNDLIDLKNELLEKTDAD